jgi:hypothetical protein
MNSKVFIIRVLILLLLFILSDFIISKVLLHGLNKYYGINEEPAILINGSSISMSGFNKNDIASITNKAVANYSHEGVSVEERYAMINQFLQENPKCVKTVIYEVNPVIFSGNPIGENVYTIFYPYMDSKTIDIFIRGNADKKDYIINKFIRTKRFDSRLLDLVVNGYLGRSENVKKVGLDSLGQKKLRELKGKVHLEMNPVKIKTFENTMDLILSHNSNIILVIMPVYYLKLETYDVAEIENLNKYFETICQNENRIKLLNLNQDTLIRDPGLFFDPIHFNVFGQQKITEIISRYLNGNSN